MKPVKPKRTDDEQKKIDKQVDEQTDAVKVLDKLLKDNRGTESKDRPPS